MLRCAIGDVIVVFIESLGFFHIIQSRLIIRAIVDCTVTCIGAANYA